MILLTGLDSVIESLYLGEQLTDINRGGRSILINPSEITYLSRRVVIINHKYYPVEKLHRLVRNKNDVYSRIDFGITGITYSPYILRINERIMMSGESVELVNEHIYSSIDHKYKGGILYYPTPRYYHDYHLNGSLTSLGYLLYQIGVNLEVLDDSIQKNLNIIKLGNGLII